MVNSKLKRLSALLIGAAMMVGTLGITVVSAAPREQVPNQTTSQIQEPAPNHQQIHQKHHKKHHKEHHEKQPVSNQMLPQQ
ncbi:hypothetical protein [Pectinatus sottacetonis]|uniref:hypothetical protein n=1 Tax=Pectinatus sottacetonis TaxID=1002795 RepID=UPI0018C5B861|nr:hypothetical protein [Pectinatus sottacetonis]